MKKDVGKNVQKCVKRASRYSGLGRGTGDGEAELGRFRRDNPKKSKIRIESESQPASNRHWPATHDSRGPLTGPCRFPPCTADEKRLKPGVKKRV